MTDTSDDPADTNHRHHTHQHQRDAEHTADAVAAVARDHPDATGAVERLTAAQQVHECLASARDHEREARRIVTGGDPDGEQDTEYVPSDIEVAIANRHLDAADEALVTAATRLTAALETPIDTGDGDGEDEQVLDEHTREQMAALADLSPDDVAEVCEFAPDGMRSRDRSTALLGDTIDTADTTDTGDTGAGDGGGPCR